MKNKTLLKCGIILSFLFTNMMAPHVTHTPKKERAAKVLEQTV